MPTREEVRQAVFDAIRSVAPETDTATLRGDRPLREQIEIDSFDFMRMLVFLHERLGVDVPEGAYGQLATVEATVDYLLGRLTAG